MLHDSLHKGTSGLLALLQITFLVFLSERRALSPLNSLDGDGLTAHAMPPSQSLCHTTVVIIDTDGPLSPTDNNFTVVAREVKLREEHLRRYIFRGSRLALEREIESRIPQIKAV